MISRVEANLLGSVPPLFGTRSEGPISIDLQELAQVYSVRDAMVRGTMQRRAFIAQNNHAALGVLAATYDLWLATNWLAISGSGGTTPGPVPQDHDALIVGIGITSGSGGTLLTSGYISALFPVITGGSINAEMILGSARGVGGSASVNNPALDLIRAPLLPYPLQLTPRPILINTVSETTAASVISFFLDVISAPIGVIRFA